MSVHIIVRISKVLLRIHISFKLQNCSKIEIGLLSSVLLSEDADLKQPNDIAIKDFDNDNSIPGVNHLLTIYY